jgi:hypothetical protein
LFKDLVVIYRLCDGAGIIRDQNSPSRLGVRKLRNAIRIAFLLLPNLTSCGVAATVPFTEGFLAGASNWADTAQTFNLDYVANGGPDGNGYVSDQQSFLTRSDGDSLVLFRAHQFLGASGGAFAGNWLSEGVGEFSAIVRHDLPVPVNFFTRFAAPTNFPGAIGVIFTPVPPNAWTRIRIAVEASNPQFVSFEGSDFASVFSGVGNVQVGMDVPQGFGMTNTAYRFDLDVASIVSVPEPVMTSWFVLLSAIAIVRGVRQARGTRGSCCHE